MRSVPFLVLAGLLALALPLFPAASAHEGPTSCRVDTNNDVWSCEFICHAGDRIQLTARTTGPNPPAEWPRLHAKCGGVDFYCQSNQQCSGTSGYVQSDGVGSCFAETVHVAGSCSAITTEQSAIRSKHGAIVVEGVATPAVESRSVDTPPASRVCAQNGLVCVGPAAPQHVADTPAVDEGEAFTEDAGVRHERSDPKTPTVTQGPVGPLVVAGEPVPVVVCDRPCIVPTGVEGGFAFFAHVQVFYGDQVLADVVLP